MPTIDQAAASRAVLIEVANVPGAYRDHMVIIGGWVPELLYPNLGHIGSLDVDFALAPTAVTSNVYETIMKRLADAGYTMRTDPTRFTRAVAGAPEEVKVDFISGQFHDGLKLTSLQINELRIGCLSGVDLAFKSFDRIEIVGAMPDGTINRVHVAIVRPEAFVLIKAHALGERVKAKDAYDIAFVLRHFQPSLSALAESIRNLLPESIARDGYQILKSKFETIDSIGPVSAGRVTTDEQSADFEQARRAAFEDAQELFRFVDGKQNGIWQYLCLSAGSASDGFYTPLLALPADKSLYFETRNAAGYWP